MNLADIVNQDIPVPGTPTEKWGFDPSIRSGYLQMTEDEYRAFPAVNASLIKCPTLAEMYALLTAPMRDTEALAVGVLADMAILTPDEPITNRFVAADVPVNPKTGECYGPTSKKAAEAMEDAKARNQGKFVVTLDMFRDYEAQRLEISRAFFRHPLCAARVKDAMLQVSGIMWHPVWNCWVKWKPDILPIRKDPDGWSNADLKTSRRSVRQFDKDCAEFGYYFQARWYSHCHEVMLKRRGITLQVANFDFLVVSKSEDGKKPRPAMARYIRVPLDASINLNMQTVDTVLFPEDGLGRVELFLSALGQHIATKPQTEAELAAVWPAYENEERPYILTKLPR